LWLIGLLFYHHILFSNMEGLKELPQGAPVPGGPTQGGEDEAKKAQEEQMRRDVMATVLDTGARERCTSRYASVRLSAVTKDRTPLLCIYLRWFSLIHFLYVGIGLGSVTNSARQSGAITADWVYSSADGSVGTTTGKSKIYVFLYAV
jgi:hypothetical protein